MTNKDKTQTTNVTLAYPIEHAGKTINALTLRRPTVSDSLLVQQAAAQNPAQAELRMVELLSGQSAEVLSKLDMQDHLAVQAALQAMVQSASK
jgi:hypothetical protein